MYWPTMRFNLKPDIHFRDTLLSKGSSEVAMQIFKNIKGSEPDIQPLLASKGLK